ncbi:MAG: hypothetical protein R3D68_08140 [Hyphomicrobiaceae bacterium]
MSAIQIIAVWGAIAIVSSVVGGVVAYAKRRDHSAWAAWCFLMPPLLLWVVLMPKNTGERPRKPTLDEEDREAY